MAPTSAKLPSLALLRDGAEAFVGVLETVSSGSLDEFDGPMQ
jgi:hypothetical protein